jgi:hypothetical protein
MTNQTYLPRNRSRTAPFEEMSVQRNKLTTLGKLLNTDTQVIALYEQITQVPERDRDARLADAESSAE